MTQEDFDRYFEGYLSGSLTPDDARALNASLQDPQWQRRWRDLSDMDGMLAEEFKVQAETVAPLQSGKSTARKPLRAAQGRRKNIRQDFSAHRWIASIAAMLLLTLGLIYFVRFEKSEATVATLKNVNGTVSLLRANDRSPAQNDQTITEGEGLLAVAGARATLQFSDGTTLTLSGETESRVWLRAPKVSDSRGKQLSLETGSLDAVVAPQPTSRPLVIHTTTSEVRVIGTEFTLKATEATARLEVRTGRVRMQHLADGKAVEVRGGFFAVAAQNVEIAAKPIPPPAPKVVRALFNGKDMTGWNQTHGAWRFENGVVVGKGAPDKFARIESTQSYQNGELACKIRLTGVRSAEVQFGGYREFFPLFFETLGVWKELKIRTQGPSISGTLDGEPLKMAPGAGRDSAAGVLSFYVTANATLEIKDATFTESSQ